MSEKYITFKTSEIDELLGDYRIVKDKAQMNRWMNEHRLNDAVVIRRRDAFAAAALHTYANSIGVAAKCIGMLAPDVSKRLQSIADYFHEQAVLSDDTETKLPD